MSDYTTALPDKYDQFVCPFEPSHKVDAFRLQRHLIRCAQSHPGKKLVRCPYNATHQIRNSELQHHLTTCEFKAVLEREIVQRQDVNAGEMTGGDCSVPEYRCIQENFDINEDWDNETTDSTFALDRDFAAAPIIKTNDIHQLRRPNSTPKALNNMSAIKTAGVGRGVMGMNKSASPNSVGMAGRAVNASSGHMQNNHHTTVRTPNNSSFDPAETNGSACVGNSDPTARTVPPGFSNTRPAGRGAPRGVNVPSFSMAPRAIAGRGSSNFSPISNFSPKVNNSECTNMTSQDFLKPAARGYESDSFTNKSTSSQNGWQPIGSMGRGTAVARQNAGSQSDNDKQYYSGNGF